MKTLAYQFSIDNDFPEWEQKKEQLHLSKISTQFRNVSHFKKKKNNSKDRDDTITVFSN